MTAKIASLVALCLLSLVCHTRVVAGQGLKSRSSSTSSSRSRSSSRSSCRASHCKRCAPFSKTTCASCYSSYVLDAGKCVACGSHCRSCDGAGAGRCDFCNTGFILSNSSCLPCAKHCDACDTAGPWRCDQCHSGYMRVIQPGVDECVPCSPGCSTCSAPDPSGCDACFMMYSLATDGSGCAFRWGVLLVLVGIVYASADHLVAMVCALGVVGCLQSLLFLVLVWTSADDWYLIANTMLCAIGAGRFFQPRRPRAIREPELAPPQLDTSSGSNTTQAAHRRADSAGVEVRARRALPLAPPAAATSSALSLSSLYPSGRWRGYYTHVGGQQHAVCEFELSFTPEGDVRGKGTDDVGCYLIRGRLADSNGRLSFTKQYQLGSRNAEGRLCNDNQGHCVEYRGGAARRASDGNPCVGSGVRGDWSIRHAEGNYDGVFHLWPVMQHWTASATAASNEAEEESECCVCFERKIDTKLEPCGHVALCAVCAGRLQAGAAAGTEGVGAGGRRCPLCRAEIQRIDRLQTSEARPSRDRHSDAPVGGEPSRRREIMSNLGLKVREPSPQRQPSLSRQGDQRIVPPPLPVPARRPLPRPPLD